MCLYGHKAAYMFRESRRSAGVRLRGPVFSTQWRWAVQSKLCPDPPDAVVWPCLCPVHAAHDREFRVSCLSWVRMFLWVVFLLSLSANYLAYNFVLLGGRQTRLCVWGPGSRYYLSAGPFPGRGVAAG